MLYSWELGRHKMQKRSTFGIKISIKVHNILFILMYALIITWVQVFNQTCLCAYFSTFSCISSSFSSKALFLCICVDLSYTCVHIFRVKLQLKIIVFKDYYFVHKFVLCFIFFGFWFLDFILWINCVLCIWKVNDELFPFCQVCYLNLKP